MIKLISFLKEENILIPRRSSEEREKNYKISTQKKIQQYIKDGSKDNLDLSHTPITSLPDNLKVGGSLYLYDTPITSLPDNLKVEGDLYLSNTPISKKYTKEEIKNIIIQQDGDIKGTIYIK
jgi:hypothetical protein